MHPSLNSQMIPGDFAASMDDIEVILGILGKPTKFTGSKPARLQGLSVSFTASNLSHGFKQSMLRNCVTEKRLSSIVEAQDVIATMIITSTRPNGGELSDFYHNYLVNLGWNGV